MYGVSVLIVIRWCAYYHKMVYGGRDVVSLSPFGDGLVAVHDATPHLSSYDGEWWEARGELVVIWWRANSRTWDLVVIWWCIW